MPTATVAPAGQPASAAPPLAVSRTDEVQVRVQLTIEIDGTSIPADAPANVSVKPVLPAPVAVTVPAKPAMPLIAVARLALVSAEPAEAERRRVDAVDLRPGTTASWR